MINISRAVKTSLWWINIVYIICFIGVAIFPEIRSSFMLYALHTNLNMGENVATWTTFISGLILWNLIAGLAVWLFAMLFNKIKDK